MSRYKPYPKYKDSGIEWLGEVPDGWEVKRLGQYFDDRRERVSDKDFPPLSVTKNGVVPQLDTAAKTDDGDNRKKVCAGDYVINSRSDRKGSSGLSSLTGSVSLINTVLVPKKIEPSFIHHLFRSYPFQEEFYRYGKGIVADLWSTNYSEMKNINIPIPGQDEQAGIANFLDRKTAKIDELIAKQEKMIELLGEKRQALISHAVTKGLDPSVKMKDSGALWLGEVPEHWGIHKLKYAVERIGDIDHYMPKTVSIGKPYIMTGDMSEKASLIDFSSCKQISEEDFSKLSQKIRPSIGDLIFARYATIGTVCYVDIEDDFLVSYSCVTIKPNHGKTSGKYLFYFFKSNFFLEEIKSYINSNTQGNVGVESLYRTKLAIPPQNEQRFIIDFIEEKTAKIDTLIQKAKQAIELLKERRTALICAAVTGKIDVRDAL